MGFPSDSSGKVCQCRRHKRLGSIPGSGRSPRGGNGNPLQCVAWRIPWTEESGGLQSIGSQRVRHNWSHLAHTHTWHRYSCFLFSSLFSFCSLSFLPLLSSTWASGLQSERERSGQSSKLIITSKLNLQLNKHRLDFLGKFQFQVFCSLSLKSFL